MAEVVDPRQGAQGLRQVEVGAKLGVGERCGDGDGGQQERGEQVPTLLAALAERDPQAKPTDEKGPRVLAEDGQTRH